MNTNFNVELRMYPHCLLFDANDEVYNDIQERMKELEAENEGLEMDENDFDFDSDEYEIDCLRSFVEEYRDLMPDIVISMDGGTVDHPREYRCFHRGDYAYADVELSEDWLDVMKLWIEENLDWFAKRIKDEWTSRDGFWSNMSTDVDEWIENLEAEEELYIGNMLYYMALVKHSYETMNDRLNEAIYENYAGCYVYLTEDGQRKIDEFEEAQKVPGWDMTNQTEIQFP